MKITVKGGFLDSDRRLKKAKLTKITAQNLSVLWLDAIQVFITKTAQHMLVDTGMSVGSLMALAEAADQYTNKVDGYVDAKMRGTGVSAVENKYKEIEQPVRRGHTNLKGKYIPSIDRTAELGERKGTKAFKIELMDSQTGNGQFQFKIVVYQHLKLMSYTIDVGKIYMESYIRTNLNKYVNIEKVFLDYLRS